MVAEDRLGSSFQRAWPAQITAGPATFAHLKHVKCVVLYE